MKTSTKLHRNIGVLVMLASTCAQAYPGESIVLDPATGNYTITYKSSDPDETRMMQTEFVPSTKIVPAIRSSFRLKDKPSIAYRYAVSNGATAKQGIVGIEIINVLEKILGIRADVITATTTETVISEIYAANDAAISSPVGWGGDVARIANEHESIDKVYWTINHASGVATDGIQAGNAISGFGFASMDLPGVGESRLNGVGAMFGYPDEGPADDSAILAELDRLRDNDYVSKPVAVPAIAVPVPFDAAVLLDRIRTHVATWTSKQLLDPTFAAQLDRYMTAAANAYRLNQPKAGKEQVETVRKMLAHEHQNLDHDEDDSEDTAEHKAATRLTIDRLAARVLDFDLRYVLKRVERERAEGEKVKR